MQQKIILFLFKHPEFAIKFLSGNYAFNEDELQKYHQILNWDYVSENESILWTIELVKKHKNKLNLEILSQNSPVFDGSNFLDAFKNDVLWKGSYTGPFFSSSIATNKHINWTFEKIWRYRNFLNFDHLSFNENVPWDEIIVDRFHSRWNWEGIGSNSGFPWTLLMFNKYLGKLDLTSNYIIYNLCYTSDISLIEQYHPYLNWKIICQSPNIPWIKENLIGKWNKYLDWSGLAFNKSLHEYPAFFEDNMKIWMSNPSKYFQILSGVSSIQWSSSFIDRFLEFWDWEKLSQNVGISWNSKMIEKYQKRIKWGGWKKSDDDSEFYEGGLISNYSTPWSIDFLIQYEDYIDLELINERVIWEKAFKPFMDEKVLQTIFRLL